jgi:hypothetical protein
MRTIWLLAAATLTLSGCGLGWNAAPQSQMTGSAAPATMAPAPAPVAAFAAPKDRLVSAIEDQGCLLTSANVASVLTQANLTQEDLLRLAPELASEGRAEVSGSGSIRVLTNRCV